MLRPLRIKIHPTSLFDLYNYLKLEGFAWHLRYVLYYRKGLITVRRIIKMTVLYSKVQEYFKEYLDKYNTPDALLKQSIYRTVYNVFTPNYVLYKHTGKEKSW